MQVTTMHRYHLPSQARHRHEHPIIIFCTARDKSTTICKNNVFLSYVTQSTTIMHYNHTETSKRSSRGFQVVI
jgi:hypothetical protein